MFLYDFSVALQLPLEKPTHMHAESTPRLSSDNTYLLFLLQTAHQASYLFRL